MISKDIFQFLSELKQNNNREWFLENKYKHDAAQDTVKEFISGLISRLSKVDPHINEQISPAKCLFRIYRDVRFSKNKTPYKTWYSAGISIDGRKLAGPEYYIHIEPGASFIAVGYWRPEKEHLAYIRQEIDYDADRLKEVLKQGGYGVDDLSPEDKLKRAPIGYAVDNPNIELLKLKSFVLYQPLADSELQSKNALDLVADIYNRMLPFKVFIHEALDQ